MADNPDPNHASGSSDDESAETYDLTPVKQGLLEQLPADLDVIGAILEMVDNSLDAWERNGRPADELEIVIEYDEENDVLIYHDNAGGAQDPEAFFALGASDPGAGIETRGAYGVGLKKATLRLSDEFVFITRAMDDDGPGVGFEITRDWLADEENWQVPKKEFPDFEEGAFEARIKNPDLDWEDFEYELQQELQKAYQRQLGGGPFDEEYNVTIRVGDRELTPPSGFNYGYPAFDGLHPREHYVEIEHDDLEEPLEVRVVVGLLAKKVSGEGGTDLYVQGRLIHEAATDEQGGFGAPDGLDEFNDSQHGRFRAALSISSASPSEQLPWNTTKDRIFPEDDVMEEVWNFFRRVADRYFEATFTRVPSPFTQFDPNSEAAYNGGKVENCGDQTGRSRITDKPAFDHDENIYFPDITRMKKLIEAHAELGIQFPNVIFSDDDTDIERAQKERIYRDYLDIRFDGVGNLRNPEELKTVPPNFVKHDIDTEEVANDLQEEAQKHARLEIRFTGHESWKQPLYDAHLYEIVGGDAFEELTEISDRDDISDLEDGGDDDDDGQEETEPVTLEVEFSADDLPLLREELGDIEADSPELRGEKIKTLVEQRRQFRSPISAED